MNLYILVCFLFFQETSSSIASSELISDDKMDIERKDRNDFLQNKRKLTNQKSLKESEEWSSQ